jgi:maleylacetoacetate isomerase
MAQLRRRRLRPLVTGARRSNPRIARKEIFMTSGLLLYDYWRSSASYRVRIALNLKGLAYETHAVHLLRDGGQQHAIGYRALNPQQLVPCLLDGERAIPQSLAIIEYHDEIYPDVPLLPVDPRGRARVRSLAMAVACDVHPLGNLRVLQYLQSQLGLSEAQKVEWSRHWITVGFDALEEQLADNVTMGRYCHGDSPTLADVCLVPQFYNALRWQVPVERYPTLCRIHAACVELDAFRRAAPEAQAGAA